MKCNNCGFDYEQKFEHCPNCGTARADVIEPISLNPVADRLMPALNDIAFLALCVLLTIYCGLSLFMDSVPLIQILITIFLWLVYADAKKGYVNHNHLQFISGTVYASYVIVNVASIILMVFGVLFGAMYSKLVDNPEFEMAFNMTITEYFEEGTFAYADVPKNIIDSLGWIIAAVFVITGAISFVFNYLANRKIHRFAKSVYEGVMFQKPFEYARSAKNWLMVFGILSAISAISSFVIVLIGGGLSLAAVVTGCEAAATIIASTLIGKYVTNDTSSFSQTFDNNI